MKLNWLDRATVHAPYMVLCLNEREYLAAAKHCKIKNPAHHWLGRECNGACTHTWASDDRLACIVCLDPRPGLDGIDVCGILAHEAVHVFQQLCDSIGESRPSVEFEAYSIGRIAERLMREYARRMGHA